MAISFSFSVLGSPFLVQHVGRTRGSDTLPQVAGSQVTGSGLMGGEGTCREAAPWRSAGSFWAVSPRHFPQCSKTAVGKARESSFVGGGGGGSSYIIWVCVWSIHYIHSVIFFCHRSMKCSMDNLKFVCSWQNSQISGAKISVKVCSILVTHTISYYTCTCMFELNLELVFPLKQDKINLSLKV